MPTFDDFAHSLAARVDLWNAAGAVGGAHAAERPDPRHARGAARLYPGADRVRGGRRRRLAAGRAGNRAAARAACAQRARGVRPAYLRPFPVVRIRGYSAPGGVRITLLSVRGPRSSRVRVAARAPVVRAVRRLRRSRRPLGCAPSSASCPQATFLRVRVTAASAMGKYTSFRIRAHGAPRRTDRCLSRAAGRLRAARRPEPALSRSRQRSGPRGAGGRAAERAAGAGTGR